MFYQWYSSHKHTTYSTISVSVTWPSESTVGSKTCVTSIQEVSVGQKSFIWISKK
jgi:hypothetical protein